MLDNNQKKSECRPYYSVQENGFSLRKIAAQAEDKF